MMIKAAPNASLPAAVQKVASRTVNLKGREIYMKGNATTQFFYKCFFFLFFFFLDDFGSCPSSWLRRLSGPTSSGLTATLRANGAVDNGNIH